MAKRCYYEVLDIERTASDGEIKTAYRKMALQWHPDKNLGNPEATATFQLIQEANSVLSDARERSWYDAHRDEILRGGDGQGGAGGDGDDDGQGGYVVNVWPYFSGGAFSGYTDAPGGFYAVYRGVFEEMRARECEGSVSGKAGGEAPGFGDSTSPWPEVAAFYAYWGAFVSTLSFGWADEWREQDAPSRQVRRAMEKENRKSREAARRKYQEAVRALVDFVKKRDKRVMQHQIEVQREEAERTRAKAEAAKTQAEAFRRQREEWLKEQTRQWEEEEAARREEEEAGGRVAFRLADEQSSGSDEEEGGGGRRRWRKKGKGGKGKGAVFECHVCNKTFKSEKQMHNHQQSRAHRKMVEELRAEFGEDVLEGLDDPQEEEGEGPDADADVDAGAVEAAAAEGGDGQGEGSSGDEEEAAAAAASPAPVTAPAAEGTKEEEEGEEEEEEEAGSEGREEGEEEEEEEDDEEEEEEEDEDVGHMARAVNRFAFRDSSSDDD